MVWCGAKGARATDQCLFGPDLPCLVPCEGPHLHRHRVTAPVEHLANQRTYMLHACSTDMRMHEGQQGTPCARARTQGRTRSPHTGSRTARRATHWPPGSGWSSRSAAPGASAFVCHRTTDKLHSGHATTPLILRPLKEPGVWARPDPRAAGPCGGTQVRVRGLRVRTHRRHALCMHWRHTCRSSHSPRRVVGGAPSAQQSPHCRTRPTAAHGMRDYQ